MIDKIEYPEGATPLDPDELNGLRFKHVTTKGQLDHLEQANIESGLLWLSKKKNRDVLNEGFVRELHKKLFGEVWEWAGTFRTTEKNIGIDPIHVAIELRKLLDDVQYWIEHKTFPASEIAIRLHHKLVYIHLFANGNGRHARIFADALLKTLGQKPIDWSGGYNLQKMNNRREAYIRALQSADAGDYSTLFAFSGIADTKNV